ncbi:hypothetical protein SLEP1_g53545 [Rubroshorea leprosula]|uniref:Uncharacterized protein n=1 Tax=Rubroshorea leprosula TaxID=152421 RepID=A0AAV5MAP7_9ROSI|nr:hypothetical protein SLEP1_g53545 [Rubroshorea leprosula]
MMMREHQLGMELSPNIVKFQQEQGKDSPGKAIYNRNDLKGRQSLLEQPSSKRELEFSKWQWCPTNLSITAEPYQEGFKIPHLETYDGSSDPDEHLHTYQAIMRIQNANAAMMCKVFLATLKSTARRWYHKLPRHSIDSYSQLAKLFSNKFASQREIKRTATELMQVHQKEGESLRDYMQRFNKATLDIDNVPDTICLSTLLHGLKRGRFLDDLLENPPKTWNEVIDRSATFILSEDFQSSKRRADDKQNKSNEQPLRREEKKKQKVSKQWGKPAKFLKYANYIPLTLPRQEQTLYYHRVYGHNTEDCQHLKDELEFLARNGKLEGYVQKLHNQQPSQTHFVQGYDRPQGQRRGQGQRTAAQNQKDRKGVGYAGIPPPSSTTNMISGGIHSGGQSARGRKAYARQVMTVNKNRPLKRPFEEAEWENAPITFSPADYKRADGEPDVMMPHADPFVATVHIDIEHRPEGVEQKVEPVEPVETVPLNPDVQERTVKIGTKLTEKERAELLEFLRVNQDVFVWTTDEMPGIPTELTGHKLSTDPTKRPVVQKRRLFGLEKQAAIDEEIQKLLQAGFIRRVEYSEWVSNPVLVKKPNGKWMMCIDFTNLNEACPKDPHPLPNVEKLVERAAGHERMSFLDASSGYHQVRLLLDDQEKTAFYAGDAIYCYVMMPFGLKNAGATYQKLVQIIFKLQIGRNIEVYVDDMIVTSVQAEDHIDDLRETFQNLRQARMKLNPLKCTFAVESGKFLGYVVSKKGIEVNPEKVQAVQQREPPRTVKDVQRLTGRVAALHRFIVKSVERCLPFIKALREPKNFQWTNECQQVFDELKQDLASAPLLSKPVEGESLYLYLGVLQGAEQNYPLAEKAAFALVCTARKLRAYFQSHQIVVYTDLPLRKILQKPKLSGRLIGWSVELSEYDPKFQPRTTIKGKAVADFLVECILATMEEKAPEHPVWVLYVDGAANVDGSGAGAVLVGPDGFKSEHALRFKFQTTNNAAEYEALIYGLKLASELKVPSIQVFSDSQLVVGQVNGSCEVRDLQLGRYASVVNRLKSGFVSFQIDKIPRADNHRADELSKLASSQDLNPQRSTIVEVLDAPSYVDFTIGCQLLSTNPSSPSWTTPLIDYLQTDKLLEDPSAAKLIKRRAAHFTLLDSQLYKRAASMPLLRCLTPYEAEYAVREVYEGVCDTHIGGRTLARKLLRHGYYWPTMVEDTQNYVKKFGIPKRIIANNGPQFRATALRSFCNDYGIELALTSVYTPQSNGQAESANKIVLRGLKTRVLAAHSNWVDELNKVLWSCRTTPSSATGETPCSLAYGPEAVIPVEVGLPSDRADRHSDDHNEQLLRENLDLVEEVREMSRIRNMAHQSRVAKFYNKRVRARQFQVGDLVLCKARLTNSYSHMGKLAPNWEGPYMVVQIK